MSETVITRVMNSDPNWTFDQWLEHGRQWWKANAARIIACDQLLVIDHTHTVKAAAQIEGVLKDLDTGSGRISITTRPQPNHPLIGTQIQRPTSRNPITYTTHPQPTN